MKVAIIGSGISSLTTAYYLNKQHEISVFEKADRLGGHTATIDFSFQGQDFAVDTGFIVFNDWTYPNFIKLLKEIGVEYQPTEMSFSVTADAGRYEYSGSSLNTLFAQRKNFFSPRHWLLIRDILRFNKEAIIDLEAAVITESMTLGDYLKVKGYSDAFIDYYLVPMGSAIWSSSCDEMLAFPLLFFVRFFKNHGLLSVKNRPQWYVIKGGSKQYLPALTQSFDDKIKLNKQIKTITRSAEKVTLHFDNDTIEDFDQVVLGCHSDQALKLLAQPSQQEKAILGAIPYRANDVVLHTDVKLLPKNKQTWSSWNYLLQPTAKDKPVLTYNMNILQGITSSSTFCVTLNATESINPDKILRSFNYAHPVFTIEGLAAQQQKDQISGHNRTWYCGAYWRNGFHEDGCVSGKQVAESINELTND